MRVLALTKNASLLVALGSMMREWEVVSVRDVASAVQMEPGSAVALIDLDDTQEGLKAATELYNQGITIPYVILGDEQVEGSAAIVLVRPFSLDDLATAVRDASTKPAVDPLRRSGSEKPSPSDPSHVEAAAPAPAAPVAPKTRPETGAPPERDKRPQKNRPLSVVPEAGRGADADAAAEPAERSPDAERRDLQQAKRVEQERLAAEQAEKQRREAERRETERAAAKKAESEKDPRSQPADTAPATIAAPEPRSETPPVRQPQPMSASAAAAPAQIEHEPSAAPDRKRLGRRGSRPQIATEEPAESPLVRRLKQAAVHSTELEALIEELPFLANLSSMADGLVGEVVSQFSAQVASVFVRRPDGFHAIAHDGLSRVEAGMVVLPTQPLFSDVLQTLEGILIQPVDLAQGLVAGIGGARTEAIMAVPSVFRGECVAIVIAGKESFTENDLDRLSDLANEAAPGLAVALALARLRERL